MSGTGMRVWLDGRASGPIAVIALVLALSMALAGCGAPKKNDAPVKQPPVESTETVVPDQDATAVPAPTGGEVPAIVKDFAKKYDGDVWYPSALPSGMLLVDPYVDELEPGSGLVCDLLFAAGSTEIGLLQGSPTTREFEIESLGTVPWGTGGTKADVVLEDPEDSASPKMLVFKGKGTLVELYGGTGLDQLKTIAASMQLVR